MDTIKIELSVTDNNYLDTTLLINNTPVNSFIDPFSFLLYWKESTNRQIHPEYGAVGKDYSDFYPLTCSCGIAGCEGIWNGILVKWRKNTVEWRFRNRVKDGYGKRLSKPFYSFDRKEYEQVARDVMEFAWENLDVERYEYSTIDEVLDWIYDNNEKAFKEINKCTH